MAKQWLKLCCHWIGLAGVFSTGRGTTSIGSVCIWSTISSIWNSKSLRIDAPLARGAVVRTRRVACNARTPNHLVGQLFQDRDGLRAVPFFSLLPGVWKRLVRTNGGRPSHEKRRSARRLVSAGSSEICPYRGRTIPLLRGHWASCSPVALRVCFVINGRLGDPALPGLGR
jgi:hypothetical protein